MVFIVFVRPACLSHQLVDDKEGLKPLADELAVLILDKKRLTPKCQPKLIGTSVASDVFWVPSCAFFSLEAEPPKSPRNLNL